MEKPHSPFFIVGCPRSGTTLLRVLTDANPSLCVPPESHVFTRFSPLFEYYGDLDIKKNLYCFVRDLLNDVWIKRWQLTVSVAQFCDQVEDRSIAGCINHLFMLFAAREGKIKWGDKSPSHGMYVREIRRIFPSAKFIHIIRDGRDVAESFKRVPFAPIDIYGAAQMWRKRVRSFHEVKGELNNDYLEVHYENLVRNPKEQLNILFDFLNVTSVDFADTVPDTPGKQGLFPGNRKNSIHAMLNEPISGRKIEIYKKTFTMREIEIFESVAGDMLTAYGYPSDTSGKTNLTAQEKVLFFVQELYRRLYKNFTQAFFVHGELQWRLRSFRLARKVILRK